MIFNGKGKGTGEGKGKGRREEGKSQEYSRRLSLLP
jgi:hypothetical protein